MQGSKVNDLLCYIPFFHHNQKLEGTWKPYVYSYMVIDLMNSNTVNSAPNSLDSLLSSSHLELVCSTGDYQ